MLKTTMLNRCTLATVAALVVSSAWLALPADANAQSRYRGAAAAFAYDRGAAAFAYQSAEQTWRTHPSRPCTYIGGPKAIWPCR